MVLDGFGWLWMVLGGCGWFWVVVDGFGSFLVLVSTSKNFKIHSKQKSTKNCNIKSELIIVGSSQLVVSTCLNLSQQGGSW